MATESERVKQWLLYKWSVIAPVDWLNACLDWVHEEEQGALAVSEVNKRVYEQWLLSDLCQIGAACLPGDLPQTQKTQLSGRFCLQMNSIIDVSTSYYSQLQKLQGTENENVQVTATQLTQTQVKTNRMLMMKLTDGSIEVQGMEYQSIPSLHTSLSPGIKIQIQGPVLCRLGMLMLKKENVQVLGGEVEPLVIDNSYQVLLTRALKSDSDPGQNPARKPNAPLPGDPRVGRKGSNNGDDTGRRKQNPSASRRGTHGVSTAETESSVDVSLSAELLDAMDEEWGNDVDMDVFEVESLKNVTKATTLPGCDTSTAKTNHRNSIMKPDGYNRHNSSSPWQQASASCQQRNSLETSIRQQNRTKLIRLTPSGGSDINRTFSDSVNAVSDCHVKSTRLSLDVIDDIDINASSQKTSMVIKTEECIDLTEATDVTSTDSVPNVHRHTLSWEMGIVAPNLSSTSLIDDVTSTEVKPDMTHLDKSLSFTKAGIISVEEDDSPYIYLCQIQWPPTRTLVIHIKAYVATLASKLDHNGGTQWSLRAKLNDGSDVIECDLADQMLTSLIGFSAAESLKMRQAAKTDKAVRRRLMEGLSRCQDSLIQMSCILDLELSPDRQRPYVLGHRAQTTQDLAALQQRVGQYM